MSYPAISTFLSMVFLILGLLPMLIVGYRYGTLSPLFLTGGFVFLAVVLRGYLLVGPLGQRLILAPWVLGQDLTQLLTISFVDLGISFLLILFGFMISQDFIRDEDIIILTSPFASAKRNDKSILFYALFGGLIGASYLWLLVRGEGSLLSNLVVLQSRAVSALAGESYSVVLHSLLLISGLNAYRARVQIELHGGHARYLLGPWIPLGLLVVSYVLTGSRGAILQLLLMLVLIRFILMGKSPNLFDRRFIGLVVVGALVVTLGLASRQSAQSGEPLAVALHEVRDDLIGATSNPFSVLDSYLLSKEYVDQSGNGLWQELGILVTRFVPRRFLPDKPLILGLRLREFFWGDKLGGIPPSIFGEFYISLGYPGVAIGSFLLGCFLGLLHRLYVLAFRHPDRVVLYAVTSSTVIFTSIRSGLEIGVVNATFAVLAIAVVRMLSRVRSRSTVSGLTH